MVLLSYSMANSWTISLTMEAKERECGSSNSSFRLGAEGASVERGGGAPEGSGGLTGGCALKLASIRWRLRSLRRNRRHWCCSCCSRYCCSRCCCCNYYSFRYCCSCCSFHHHLLCHRCGSSTVDIGGWTAVGVVAAVDCNSFGTHHSLQLASPALFA